MTEYTVEELKEKILSFDDKYRVTFTKADGTLREMTISKIAQARAAAAIAVRKEKEALQDSFVSLRPAKPVDENMMNVFEVTVDGLESWKKVDLRRVISIEEVK